MHGAVAAVCIINKYMEIARSSLVGESFVLERAGDQLVIVLENADDLAKTAIELERKSEHEPHFLGIHAGLHYGAVLEEEGHFFGSTINLAARIAARAKENRILCSRDFINALSQPAGFRFVPHGKVRFKNILESKEIFELVPEVEKEVSKIHVDPVCRMHLEPDETHIHYTEDGEKYFFCSPGCSGFLKNFV